MSRPPLLRPMALYVIATVVGMNLMMALLWQGQKWFVVRNLDRQAESLQAGAATSRPSGDWLRVPEAGIDSPVEPSPTTAPFANSIAYAPDSTGPGDNRKIVITSDSFSYLSAGDQATSFSLLHRLEPGDQIYLYRNGRAHTYSVMDTRVLPVGYQDHLLPTQVEQLVLAAPASTIGRPDTDNILVVRARVES